MAAPGIIENTGHIEKITAILKNAGFKVETIW